MDKNEEKNKRNNKIQIRITLKEKNMIEILRKIDPEFNISKLFRTFLKKHFDENGLKVGISNFIIS